MKHIRSFIILLAGLSLSLVMSVLVLTKGWGLEPKSWWWIIGGGVIGQLLAQCIILASKTDEE